MPYCINADFSGISPVPIDLTLTLLLKNIVVRYYRRQIKSVSEFGPATKIKIPS